VIIEDFTMLGTTVPEPIKSDGRVSVCSAGVSAELGLIRIYPLARAGVPNRWNTYRVPVERNPKDSRPESWKLKADRHGAAFEQINRECVQVGHLKPAHRADALKKYVVGSIAEANAKRMSLAILQPQFREFDFLYNPDSPDSPELKLFDIGEPPKDGSKRFPYIPKLHFDDEDGHHHLQVRDWGGYEWMRKYPDRYRELPNCLHLSDDSSLLVGNFNQHRTSWLIISVLNGIRDDVPTLFDFEESA
jgi:hypothetical protein